MNRCSEVQEYQDTAYRIEYISKEVQNTDEQVLISLCVIVYMIILPLYSILVWFKNMNEYKCFVSGLFLSCIYPEQVLYKILD